MHIRIDDLEGEEVKALLQEHLDDMLLNSPEESCHALDLGALKAPNITFWSAWSGGDLAGFGALKEINRFHGEIKSMRTSRSYLKQGVAAKLLSHILNEAENRAYSKISLETGSMEAFTPALTLYKRFGFNECAPFDDYKEDPYSIFMTKSI